MKPLNQIDWLKIEEEATTMQSLPDSIPVNIREWENFRVQYEILTTYGIDRYLDLYRIHNVDYKKSLKEIADHAYTLDFDKPESSDKLNPFDLNSDGKKIYNQTFSLKVTPRFIGQWLESHGIHLRTLYMKNTQDSISGRREVYSGLSLRHDIKIDWD